MLKVLVRIIMLFLVNCQSVDVVQNLNLRQNTRGRCLCWMQEKGACGLFLMAVVKGSCGNCTPSLGFWN